MKTNYLQNQPPFSQWLEDQLSTKGGASHSGYHFIFAYLDDPYAWYLQYVCGLRPKYTGSALLMGRSFHAAAEAAYRYGKDQALQTYTKMQQSQKQDYEDQAQYAKDNDDGRKMLTVWADTWLDYDREHYDILQLEDQNQVTLANGYTLTVRFDQLMRRKEDRMLVIKDIKTSRYSIAKAHQYLSESDQSTAYLLAAKKLWPNDTVLGVASDVAYKRQSVVKAERPGIVSRSDSYLAAFELNLIGIMSELSHKVLAVVEDDYPPALLFPRNRSKSALFGNPWPPNVYDTIIDWKSDEIPHGCIKDPAQTQAVIDTAKSLSSVNPKEIQS